MSFSSGKWNHVNRLVFLSILCKPALLVLPSYCLFSELWNNLAILLNAFFDLLRACTKSPAKKASILKSSLLSYHLIKQNN